MKMKLYILFFLTIFALSDCDLFRCEIPQEYNPQKAGADIAARITVSTQHYSVVIAKPYYIGYYNHQCYFLDENQIEIYNLTNDTINNVKKIPFNLNTVYRDESDDYRYSINKCNGLFVVHNKIICVLSVNKKNKTQNYCFGDVLSVEYNEQNNKWSDATSDIQNFPIDCLDYRQKYWFDNSDNILYAGSYGRTSNDKVTIKQYQYNTETHEYSYIDSLEFIPTNSNDDEYNGEINLFLMHNLFLVYKCDIYASGDSDSYLLFYPNYKSYQSKKIHLDYLHLFREPISIFSDENEDIWIYMSEYIDDTRQDKYELLKLKLL